MTVRGKETAGLLVVIAGGLLLLVLISALPPPAEGEVGTPWIGPWLWEARSLDMALQALLILAGVLGVLSVLGGRGREK